MDALAAADRIHKGSPAPVVPGVDIRSGLNERLHDPPGGSDSEHQRCPSPRVSSIDVGAAAQQRANRTNMPVGADIGMNSVVQSRPAIGVSTTDRRADINV